MYYNDINYTYSQNIFDICNPNLVYNYLYVYNTQNDNIVEFTVYGEPKGKGRPRFRRFGNFTTTYSDAKTKTLEKNIRDSYTNSRFNTMDYNTSPIGVDINFFMPIPKSLSLKKAKELIDKPHTKKPDVDNMCKSVFDGLNEKAFKDDSQIWRLLAEKRYGIIPRTEVRLTYY